MNDKTPPGMNFPSPQPNDSSNHPPLNFSLRFWGLVLLTGIGAGIGAGLLMKLLRVVQHLFYSYHAGNFLTAVEHATPLRRAVVVSSAGVIAALGVWILRRSRGGKAGGLNESIWFRSGRMASGKTIAQALLSIVIVAMGASLGREGAPKETGAAIASKLSGWAGLSPAETRLLVACGAGAGMAAVYNVPLGGALFALEVLLGSVALPLIPPALATSFIATAVAWLMLPNTPTYQIPSYAITTTQLIWSIGFGPIAGVASVFFVRLVILADGMKPKRGIMLAMPILIFAMLGLVSILYPQLLGNGKDATQLGLVGQISLPLLFALIFLKPLATAACLGSGAPGGLFTPTVTFGTVLGGFFGHGWSFFWPGATSGSYAVIGAAAVLAAAMQAPLAAIVLVLELTHHVMTIMVPILFSVAGAAVTARLIDRRSIYSGRVHVVRQAALADADIPYHHLVSKDVATISISASYTEVLERLLVTANHPRPVYVLDENGSLVGRIRLANILHPDALPPVLSTAAAADLMEPVQSLTPSLSESSVLARLNAEPAGELPVTDAQNRQVLGIAIRP
ncbi:MAG: chloride channel protein [Gammaproteobacteria bacterium]